MTGGARSPDDATRGRARAIWWFVVVCAAALLGYVRSFDSPFEFDDFPNIVQAPGVQAESFEAFFRYARARVVPSFTFLLNYRLGGEDPVGYHVVNFAVHLLATLAVYALVLALCRTPRLRNTWLAGQRLPLAVATALIFACHPIQTEAVTYIVQRVSSLATLFYVGSVLLYVRARNAQIGTGPGRPVLAYTGSALSALAALLSKENTASLPLAILLAEWTFYPGSAPARRLLRLGPFVALVLVIPLAWWLFGTRYWGGSSLGEQLRYLADLLTRRARPIEQISPLQYFFTQCTVLPRYLRLVILPWGFNVDHDVPVATGLSVPVAAGLAFLAALLGFGLYALRRWPLLGFGIVWFFLAQSVESSFFPIQDVMVERRMYLAMPGVAIALAVPFAWLLCRRRAAALAGGAAIAAGLCVLTFMRNEVWRTPVSLWEDALAKAPGKARVHTNLGTALYLDGRKDDAVVQFCQALAIDPGYKPAEMNLNASVEEEVDDNGDESDDGEVELEVVETGPDGALAVAPKDPCARFKAER